MSNRDITWACSRCDATFSTREALKSHISASHCGRTAQRTANDDSVTPDSKVVVERQSSRPLQASSAASKSWPGRSTAVAEEADVDARLLLPEQHASIRSPQSARGSASVTCASRGKEPRPLEGEPRQWAASRTTGAPIGRATLQSHDTQRPSASVSQAWRWVAVIVICIASVSVLITFRHQITLAAARQPTPFTELFFNRPNSLPTSLSLSGPNVLSFSVVNHEGHATVYSYVVTLASSQGTSTVDQGQIALKDNGAATRLVDVRPTLAATKFVVTVSLLGRSESISSKSVSQ